MRTMLVGAVMLLACRSGAARADEASAVKAVEKLGGKVTRDEKAAGKPAVALSLWGTPARIVTDDSMKPVRTGPGSICGCKSSATGAGSP